MAYIIKETDTEIDFGEASFKTRLLLACKMILGLKIKVKKKVRMVE